MSGDPAIDKTLVAVSFVCKCSQLGLRFQKKNNKKSWT